MVGCHDPEPERIDPPMLELSVLPIAFFAFKTIKMFYLYHTRVQASFIQTVAAGLAGLSLSHTIAKAVILGFFYKGSALCQDTQVGR